MGPRVDPFNITCKQDRAAPEKKAPRRVPLAYAADEKKAIEDLKAKGVIGERVLPWAAPLYWLGRKMVDC